MKIEYDTTKNDKNVRERDLSFEQVADFDFVTAQFTIDDRQDYGETRFRVLGFVGRRLHALVFVETTNGIRVISFRKANKREVKHYESKTRTIE